MALQKQRHGKKPAWMREHKYPERKLYLEQRRRAMQLAAKQRDL